VSIGFKPLSLVSGEQIDKRGHTREKRIFKEKITTAEKLF
jgi:hypothetical protein